MPPINRVVDHINVYRYNLFKFVNSKVYIAFTNLFILVFDMTEDYMLEERDKVLKELRNRLGKETADLIFRLVSMDVHIQIDTHKQHHH